MAWAWASPGKKSTHLSGRGLPGDGVCKPVSSWGFMCVQGWGGVFPSFRAPNSDSSFWLGGTFVQTWSFWKCHGLCSPQFVVSIFTTNWGVNFHYDDGIMSFGMGVHSIFPPSWNHVGQPVLIFDFHTHRRSFPEINCFLFAHKWMGVGLVRGCLFLLLYPIRWISPKSFLSSLTST